MGLDKEELKLTRENMTLLGMEPTSNPICDDFVFMKVSDNGSNIKAAWSDGRWLFCSCHTLELCTLPITYTQKKSRVTGELVPPQRGSVQDSFTKARGIVGYLHVSLNAQSDFHSCQKRFGLPETKIDQEAEPSPAPNPNPAPYPNPNPDPNPNPNPNSNRHPNPVPKPILSPSLQDVRTRWRSSFTMAEQLLFNKDAVLEMDKNPAYRNPGEVWGKNKLSLTDWDHLEQGAAVLSEAAAISQLLEGDKYPTVSLVVPTMFRLMATSARGHDIYFANRDEDEHNDPIINPVKVKHAELSDVIQAHPSPSEHLIIPLLAIACS